MVTLDKNKIHLTRGDSLEVGIAVDGYSPTAKDLIMFRMKPISNTGEIIVEKNIDPTTMVLKLIPEDTKRIEPGRYKYEIEVKKEDGFTATIIEWESIEIGREIG